MTQGGRIEAGGTGGAAPRLHGVLVPAAGLGTRVSPLTLGVSKELLPLGAYPAMTAMLLEATAAGARELVVITAPESAKPHVGRFFAALGRLAESGGAAATTPAAAALARLLAELTVRTIEQPQPLGVLDAVERGLGLVAAPCAVLFPDLIHLPDQTGLVSLWAAHAACGEAVIGVRATTPAAPGTTAAVTVPAQYVAALPPPGTPLPIRAVGPARGVPGEIVTTLGQIHTAAMGEAIEACCRTAGGGPLSDGGFLQALDQLAKAGKLYGTPLPGEVIDLGNLPGYLDAAARFASGAQKFRGLP